MDAQQLKKMYGWYLTCSYAYYHMDVSLMSDEKYDQMCKVLAKHFEEIQHRYWYVTRREDFEAGTGFAIQWPPELASAIRRWVLLHHGDKVNEQHT